MATDLNTTVEQLYVAYFSRPADPAGLQYWVNVLSNNPNGYQAISANFAASQEYKATFAGMDNNAVISTVYEHLFGHAPDSAGAAYWVNLLNQNAITIDNVVTQIAGGAQGTDAFAYNAKVAVATAFTAHVDTPAEQAAYAGAAANQIAINYVEAVKDLQSAAAGMDPGNIDNTIAQIVGTHTSSVEAPAHIA